MNIVYKTTEWHNKTRDQIKEREKKDQRGVLTAQIALF
jgi:hypothetical protein